MNLLLAINIPCWLIPILVGLICAILGYLLGRLIGGSNKIEVDEDAYKNRISKLESDLESCSSTRSKLESDKTKLEIDLADCKSNRLRLETDLLNAKNAAKSATTSASTAIASSFTAPSTPEVNFDAGAAKAVFGKRIKLNDLKVVEGIGPKIEQLFHSFDIKTWAALGNTSVEKCQEVLKSGGKRFDIHKPGTWPEQAKLASEGKWQKLKEWQDSLDGGK